MGRRYRPQCRRSGRLCMLVPSQSKSLALTWYGLDAPWPAVRSGCTGAVSTAQSQGMAMHSCSESEHESRAYSVGAECPVAPGQKRKYRRLSATQSQGMAMRPCSESEHGSDNLHSAVCNPLAQSESDVQALSAQCRPAGRSCTRAPSRNTNLALPSKAECPVARSRNRMYRGR